MSKRAALISALLLAGVAIAVIGATAALGVIGNGAFGPGKTLTQADVRRSLAQQSAPAQPTQATPRSSAPASPPASGSEAVSFASSGGTVLASCSSGQVTLSSWIPAQGYETDGVSRGPARSAWVRFKSSGAEVTVTATCAGGRPRFAAASA
ncbi:MAG: hypothetical protein ACTHKL_16880, partial [Streptosporangiaceae bacterium]